MALVFLFAPYLLTWLIVGLMNFPFSPFYLMVPVFFMQAFIQVREDKKKKVKTFTDEAIDYVWIGFFLASFGAFCGFFAGESYSIITIIIFLSGMAAYITGAISKIPV